MNRAALHGSVVLVAAWAAVACDNGGSGGATGNSGAAGSATSAGIDAAGLSYPGLHAEPPSVICPAGPYAPSPLVGQDLATQQVCDGFTFTEGPVWFASNDTLFFSDFQQSDSASNFSGNIVQYTPGGSCDVFIEGNGSNGLAIAHDGQLLAAQHLSQTVTEYNLQTKEHFHIVTQYMGKHFSSPNDVAVHSNGMIYFSDPAYEVGDRPEELAQAAYCRDTTGFVKLIEELDRPNGITLSPDETKLYISTTSEVRVYDVDASGIPANGRTFAATFSDGMTVDCAGNLYLANGGGGGVLVYDSDGNQLGLISSPGTSNVAFGGPDRKTLFVAGGDQIRSITLNIPGLPY